MFSFLFTVVHDGEGIGRVAGEVVWSSGTPISNGRIIFPSHACVWCPYWCVKYIKFPHYSPTHWLKGARDPLARCCAWGRWCQITLRKPSTSVNKTTDYSSVLFGCKQSEGFSVYSIQSHSDPWQTGRVCRQCLGLEYFQIWNWRLRLVNHWSVRACFPFLTSTCRKVVSPGNEGRFCSCAGRSSLYWFPDLKQNAVFSLPAPGRMISTFTFTFI